MKINIFLIISIFSLGTTYGASFDCKKAITGIEKTICNNPELSKLDGELGEIYKKLVKTPRLKIDHKRYLSGRDKNCKTLDPKCLIREYKHWIADYKQAIWFTKQKVKTGCYGSKNTFKIHWTEKNNYFISIDTYGSNGHTCDASGTATKEYGYFYFASGNCHVKIRIEDNPKKFVVDFPEDGHDDCSCGSRATLHSSYLFTNRKKCNDGQ